MTPGDAARTATDILASEGLFRLGVAALSVVVALDVVVAWALYRVFSPVSTGISLLASWFRLVYAGVLLVAVSHLVEVLRLLGDDQYRAAFNTDQLQAQALSGIHSFGEVFGAGLLLFGLHLLVVGYLAYRSGYVPRVIGVLLAVAGLGYVVDSVAAILFRGSWTDVSSFTFIGEFLLALWLVVRSSRVTSGGPAPPGATDSSDISNRTDEAGTDEVDMIESSSLLIFPPGVLPADPAFSRFVRSTDRRRRRHHLQHVGQCVRLEHRGDRAVGANAGHVNDSQGHELPWRDDVADLADRRTTFNPMGVQHEYHWVDECHPYRHPDDRRPLARKLTLP